MATEQAPPSSEQIRDAWDAIAPRFDRYTSEKTIPFGEQLLGRVELGTGTRFLDVGAGSGALAIPAARRGADVVAVDLAPEMIARLDDRAHAEGFTLDGRVMDGQALDLPDDSFDIAASLNGVSLFPDLGAGLRELVRVVRPGGQVLIGAFGDPRRAEFITFFLAALQAAVPGSQPLPMDPPPLPFQVAEPQRLQQVLTEAGLSGVEIDTVTWRTTFASAQEFWDVVTASNPIAVQLTAGLSDQQVREVQAVMDGMLRERSGGDAAAELTTDVNVAVGVV